MKTSSAPDPASLLDEILRWCERRPTWEQDALHRLSVRELDENDVSALAALCLAESMSDGAALATATVLSRDDLAFANAKNDAVVVTAITSLNNVNGLADGQNLSFDATGVTLVYGDNGAGKSGYIRVLKQTCFSRGTPEDVLGNAYRDSAASPSAQIQYVVGATGAAEFDWSQGGNATETLRRIHVFDSRSAFALVEQKNELAFAPAGLDLFPRLVAVSGRVKARLSEIAREIQQRSQQFPTLEANDTAVGIALRDLGNPQTKSSIEALARLSDEERARLTQLKRDVPVLQSGDSNTIAQQMTLQAARVDSVVQRVNDLHNHLSDTVMLNARTAVSVFRVAREAAELSAALLANEPLPSTGSETWKTLWAAAREFSNLAYPADSFPVTANDARCVLCQQELGADAGARMLRFEQYVNGVAQQDFDTRGIALEEVLSQFRQLAISRDGDATLLGELETLDPQLKTDFEACIEVAEARRELLVQIVGKAWVGQAEGAVEEIPERAWGPSPSDALKAKGIALCAQSAEMMGKGAPAEVTRLAKELQELQDREALSALIANVVLESERRQEIARYHAAAESCNTAGITRKNTELSSNLVMDKLVEQYQQELSASGLQTASLELHTEGATGTAYHRLALQNAMPGASPALVLSEGERRVAALGAFLAEVEVLGDGSSLIFDDPTSSLDHRFREYIAKRLVQEAKQRQIVIFTHDIVFHCLIAQEAERESVRVALRELERSEQGTGCVAETLRCGDVAVKQRIGAMKQRVQEGKKFYTAGNESRWKREARELTDSLRAAWERTVEEVLLNRTVERFSRQVATQRLKLATDLTASDYERVESAMTQLSEWTPAHDDAAALQWNVPSPDDMDRGIGELESLVAEVRKRRA